jgi:hypothetical protein
VDGAIIAGRIDLNHIRTTTRLQLSNVTISDGITLLDARIPSVTLLDTTLGSTNGRALDATQAIIEIDLNLPGLVVTSGMIRIAAAHIGGQLLMTGADLANASGPAILADGVTVAGNAYLGVTANGGDENGTIRLADAHIGGQLDMANANLTNRSGPALLADGLIVDSSARLAVSATGTGEVGTVSMVGAHIGAQLMMAGADLVNQNGPAIRADNLTVKGNAYLAVTAVGEGDNGAVRFPGVRIGGELDMVGANLVNRTGPALTADTITVNSLAQLTFTAKGRGRLGAVRLIGARFGGQLDMGGADIINRAGPALLADTLSVSSYARLSLTATGGGDLGTIRLVGAHIETLNMDGAILYNESGPALDAANLSVANHAYLSVRTTGDCEHSTIRLVGAHIGMLNMDGATLVNPNGPGLDATNVKVNSDAYLTATATGGSEHGAVRLFGAHIGGQLNMDSAKLRNEIGPALHADRLTVEADALLRLHEAVGSGNLGAIRLVGSHIGGQVDLACGAHE